MSRVNVFSAKLDQTCMILLYFHNLKLKNSGLKNSGKEMILHGNPQVSQEDVFLMWQRLLDGVKSEALEYYKSIWSFIEHFTYIYVRRDYYSFKENKKR